MEGASGLYISRKGSLARTLTESSNKRSFNKRRSSLSMLFRFSLFSVWTALIMVYMVFFIHLLVKIEAPVPASLKPLGELISYNETPPIKQPIKFS